MEQVRLAYAPRFALFHQMSSVDALSRRFWRGEDGSIPFDGAFSSSTPHFQMNSAGARDALARQYRSAVRVDALRLELQRSIAVRSPSLPDPSSTKWFGQAIGPTRDPSSPFSADRLRSPLRLCGNQNEDIEGGAGQGIPKAGKQSFVFLLWQSSTVADIRRNLLHHI